MRINSIGYTFRQGVKNIRRNLLFSLASIGTIVACLFLFGVLYGVIVNFRSAIKNIEGNISISVFFDAGITSDQVDMIREQIRTRDEVATLDYISAEEAWRQFSEANYDDPEAARETFGEDNPLANSASFTITLKDVSYQADFVQFVSTIKGVRKVKSSEYTANNVAALNKFVGYASVGIIVILFLVSIFLISNTITIGITVRKEEIRIMKLIGATNAFVRAPFIVEGVLIGLIGSAIPVVILYYMYDAVINYVVGRFTVLKSIFEFVPAGDLFKVLLPMSLGIGIGIGFIGSWLTTRKHLKV
ncbi:MAG: permease-like cell division protein FtsX [Eubacterium sp.]|nr:permease-like cell division protein FtsX [Eubacterium sp.]